MIIGDLCICGRNRISGGNRTSHTDACAAFLNAAIRVPIQDLAEQSVRGSAPAERT